VNTIEITTRKAEPLPPAFTAALTKAFESETDPDRSVADIILEVIARFEAEEPTC